jgi:diguanylate cyclase (GGDEF)-like protein
MFRLFHFIHNYFSPQRRSIILLSTFILIVLIGILDYVTGFEISLSLLYVVPISLATWYINSRAGYVTIGISVGVSILSNAAAGQTYSHEIIWYWNGFTRLLLFVLILWLLQEFKRALYHERMLAQTDYLTGIANSREFYRQVAEELARAKRSKQPISLAYIDLDGFKHVNDHLGHLAGDHLLRVVAQTIQSTIRKTDLAGRLGGDEFAILMPNTDHSGMQVIIGRVRDNVLQQMKLLQSSITLSAGVICFDLPPTDVDHMIQQADRLMYRVKAQGKNDVLYFEN